MARKSADATRTTIAGRIVARILAPAGLTEAEAALWQAVVDSKPAEWFGPDSAPILVEYVRAVSACDTLDHRVKVCLARATDLRETRAFLIMRDRESRRASLLATKLRLTQQSRYTPQAAATADSHAAGKRPWQN
jgi:hypothetical protein